MVIMLKEEWEASRLAVAKRVKVYRKGKLDRARCKVPVKDRGCSFKRAFPRCHNYSTRCNLDPKDER